MADEGSLHRLGLLSQSLVEPSMSVNRKVTVPVGGLLIGFASPFLSRGHYSSRGYKQPITPSVFI